MSELHALAGELNEELADVLVEGHGHGRRVEVLDRGLGVMGAMADVPRAVYGLPLRGDGLALYPRCTDRQMSPERATREVWCVVGRRGGKSRVASLLAVWTAAVTDWRPFLATGEKATVAVIAADRQQARVAFRYITGLIDAVPMLARQVVRRTANAIELRGRVVIEVHTCSFRSVRGYSFAAVIADEVAF